MTTTTARASEKLLYKYQNGNVHVQLFDDGTKIRSYEGEPKPEFPESIDLKITNYCERNCSFCHENSTTRGKHGSEFLIADVLKGLPPGVEIAIGGGDPVAHPYICAILQEIHYRGLVPNLTVHGYTSLISIAKVLSLGYVRALGISLPPGSSLTENSVLNEISGEHNLVLHLIAGLNTPRDFWFHAGRGRHEFNKILLLGYKFHGRGLTAERAKVEENLRRWRFHLRSVLPMESVTVCFDNLAIEQLRLKERLSEDTWNRCYMGDDGQFTMYFDAVRDEFAVSSTSPRIPRRGRNIREMFQIVRAGNSLPVLS